MPSRRNIRSQSRSRSKSTSEERAAIKRTWRNVKYGRVRSHRVRVPGRPKHPESISHSSLSTPFVSSSGSESLSRSASSRRRSQSGDMIFRMSR